MTQNPKHTLEFEESANTDRPSKISKADNLSDDDDGEEEEAKAVIGDQGMSQGNPRIQRYLVAIEYIGTRFSGSQKQLSCRTVVGVLEVI